jgi:hypothetical protein
MYFHFIKNDVYFTYTRREAEHYREHRAGVFNEWIMAVA